jgi:hypothetical protein
MMNTPTASVKRHNARLSAIETIERQIKLRLAALCEVRSLTESSRMFVSGIDLVTLLGTNTFILGVVDMLMRHFESAQDQSQRNREDAVLDR